MDEEVQFPLQQSVISTGHPCPESSASFSLPLKPLLGSRQDKEREDLDGIKL